MRLIACSDCHAQYDVTHVATKHFPCRCGSQLENRVLTAVDAEVHRCGSCGAIVNASAEGCSFCGSEIVRDARRLSLICPECFARNAEESRFCTACGIAFRPEAVRVDAEELPCPSCGGLMPGRAVGGVAVNECPGCNGLWAPGESFDVLVKRAAEARRENEALEVSVAPRTTGSNPAAQKVAYRNCPACDAHMHRRNYGRSSGVIVDVCHEHGTWLDADELEQIAGYILSGRAAEKAFVHREHEDASQILRDDPARAAAANAAFQRVLARNQAESYASGRRRSGLFRTVTELLELLLT